LFLNTADCDGEVRSASSDRDEIGALGGIAVRQL